MLEGTVVPNTFPLAADGGELVNETPPEQARTRGRGGAHRDGGRGGKTAAVQGSLPSKVCREEPSAKAGRVRGHNEARSGGLQQGQKRHARAVSQRVDKRISWQDHNVQGEEAIDQDVAAECENIHLGSKEDGAGRAAAKDTTAAQQGQRRRGWPAAWIAEVDAGAADTPADCAAGEQCAAAAAPQQAEEGAAAAEQQEPLPVRRSRLRALRLEAEQLKEAEMKRKGAARRTGRAKAEAKLAPGAASVPSQAEPALGAASGARGPAAAAEQVRLGSSLITPTRDPRSVAKLVHAFRA